MLISAPTALPAGSASAGEAEGMPRPSDNAAIDRRGRASDIAPHKRRTGGASAPCWTRPTGPRSVEGRQYDRWEAAGAFRADPAAGGEPYAIMIPPPNVTGSLHIGHAFNNTIQDILIRFYRMQGRNVLWQPGTDHAGIATQMVVERMLAEQGIALDRGIPPKDGETARRSGARPSSRRSGPGGRNPAARFSNSCAGSARPATGHASASRWTRACPGPCCASSSGSTRTA